MEVGVWRGRARISTYIHHGIGDSRIVLEVHSNSPFSRLEYTYMGSIQMGYQIIITQFLSPTTL